MGMLPDYLPGYQPVQEPQVRTSNSKGSGTRKLPEHAGGWTRSTMLGRKGRISGHVARPPQPRRLRDVLRREDRASEDGVRGPPEPLHDEDRGDRPRDSAGRRLRRRSRSRSPARNAGSSSPRKWSNRPAGLTSAWQQIVQVASRLGANWSYNNSADVMKEIGRAVPFYEGANYENLAREYGRQWPCTNDRPLGTPYLCSRRSRGRHRPFSSCRSTSAGASRRCTAADFPFTLTFGHSLYYWHQNALIQHSETLKARISASSCWTIPTASSR